MNLIEGLQKEQTRVRELLTEYEAIGSAGVFGAIMLKQLLAKTDNAIATGDTVQMLVLLKELQECN
jgi:hypothetical protein